MYYAHSLKEQEKTFWQPQPVHAQAVAKTAAWLGERLGIGGAAGLAGLLHDLGKYTPEFQARLEGARQPAEHSIQGAWAVRNMVRVPHKLSQGELCMADLIAYAIAGHHAGLPDMYRAEKPDASLHDRLLRHGGQGLDLVWKQELVLPEPNYSLKLPPFQWKFKDKSKTAFQLSVLGRMIFSCLVDADFKDTEAFYAQVENRHIDRHWPSLQKHLPELIAAYETTMAQKADCTATLGRLRGDILRQVRENASMSPGLFTLTVPTGGGKTLASLGFALDHARQHGHCRIIYAIPYTSIIDQTVDVFRQTFASLSPDDIVLEHHSALDDEADPKDGRGSLSGKDKLKLAMEDWAAPLIVTTNVQLFESLFASKPSRARKLHNIANSIIILDEAQTLPRPLLAPTVQMLDELALNYGCTIVFCTATQPALDERKFPVKRPMGLALQDRELAPDPARLAEELRRVTIVRASEKLSDEALVEELAKSSQALMIVNTRVHAKELYELGQQAGLQGLVHLTTRQYATHRRRILADVRLGLAADQACRVIATSLIEAGVDVDFPRVWRASTGLDQIAQAAGRCNREGRRAVADSIVTVFESATHAAPPGIMKVIAAFKNMAEKYPDLLSPEAMDAYFAEVYWQLGKGLDAEDILEKFKIGKDTFSMTDFAYRSVAEKYKLIKTAMLPVIIARDDRAKKTVEELSVEKIPSGALARKLQSFVVQVPATERAKLIANGHVYFVAPELRADQFAVLKTDRLYTEDLGLLWENADYLNDDAQIL